MVYYLNKSLLHRPLTRQIQGTQFARVQNLTLTISDRAAAMKPSASIAAKKIVSDLQASGHEIIDLTIGEPDIATPAHIVDGALAAMRSGETHYTPSAGTLPLRRADRKSTRLNSSH